MDAYRPIEGNLAAAAAAIGEPARTRMLVCLLDGRARTSTELALVAHVSPSTASIHLGRLKDARLVQVLVQGKHRYYSLAGPDVAGALEALSILAGSPTARFTPSTPVGLRAARTCYDHIAGSLGVALHDRLMALGWLTPAGSRREQNYDVTPKGDTAMRALGIDVAAARAQRRRFAFACLDWSERRPHVGGAIGASLLKLALAQRWLAQGRHDRLVRVTALGRREFARHFGLRLPDST